MVLKYKKLALHILSIITLLNSTNSFAGNGKEEEKLNYFPVPSLSKGSAQLTPNFEKPQSTHRPPRKRHKNNVNARGVPLEDLSIVDPRSQVTTTSTTMTNTSGNYSAASQEKTVFNLNNLLSTFSPSTNAEKKGFHYLSLALLFDEDSQSSNPRLEDRKKRASYFRKALNEFQTSLNGLALIASLSSTSEGLQFLQSIKDPHRTPTQTLPMQTLPVQTSLSTDHPLNTPTMLPPIQALTYPPQSRISLPPFQISSIPPSGISAVPPMAINNLGLIFQGGNISLNQPFYQATAPFFPSPTSGFTSIPVNPSTSSSSTSYSSQQEQQALPNIDAVLQLQKQWVQKAYQQLKQLEVNLQSLEQFRHSTL